MEVIFASEDQESVPGLSKQNDSSVQRKKNSNGSYIPGNAERSVKKEKPPAAEEERKKTASGCYYDENGNLCSEGFDMPDDLCTDCGECVKACPADAV